MFENRVLRRIFGPKREEVAGLWIKLHFGELHNLYSSPDDVRETSRRYGTDKKYMQNFGRKT
jgi:hypothetical protein